MIIERQIQIVTRHPEHHSTPVQVFLRIGEILIETGITADTPENAAELVAAKLSGRT